MKLSEEERQALIEYRMNQADDSIKIAEKLIGMENYPTALNRIYYSVFYSLLAIALKHDFKTSKHSQLIGWFNKNFITSKKLETSFGKIIRKTFEYRLMADYDAFVEFDKENVNELHKQTIELINRIRELIKS